MVGVKRIAWPFPYKSISVPLVVVGFAAGMTAVVLEWKEEGGNKEAAAEAKAAAEVKRQSTIVEIANLIVEKAIRKSLKKPTGELTEADLEKVKELYLGVNKLTDVKGLEKLTELRELYLHRNQLIELPKGLEKLTQLKKLFLNNNQLTEVKRLEKLTRLEVLHLENNPDLTKAQIDQLKKALPKCYIGSNPKK